MPTSRYCLVIDNISIDTRSADIRYEMERTAGKVREVVRDPKHRCALVEFDRSDDCSYAWKKMDGVRIDGRYWKIDYATPSDFKFFDKEWFEGGYEKRGRSRSRSRSASRTPPGTPRDEDRRPRSPSAAKTGAGSDDEHRGRGRSPSSERNHDK